MDTLAVIYRRLKRGVSPFTPDRTHIHHLLMNAGLGPRRTLVYLVGYSIVLPFAGVVIHAELGAIANLVAFVVVAAIYGAFTTHLERQQAALIQSSDAAVVRPDRASATSRTTVRFRPVSSSGRVLKNRRH